MGIPIVAIEERFVPAEVELSIAMGELVTSIAKSDEVRFRVVASLTAELRVVYLNVLHCSTALTPPTFALKNFPAELLVGSGV